MAVSFNFRQKTVPNFDIVTKYVFRSPKFRRRLFLVFNRIREKLEAKFLEQNGASKFEVKFPLNCYPHYECVWSKLRKRPSHAKFYTLSAGHSDIAGANFKKTKAIVLRLNHNPGVWRPSRQHPKTIGIWEKKFCLHAQNFTFFASIFKRHCWSKTKN